MDFEPNASHLAGKTAVCTLSSQCTGEVDSSVHIV